MAEDPMSQSVYIHQKLSIPFAPYVFVLTEYSQMAMTQEIH